MRCLVVLLLLAGIVTAQPTENYVTEPEFDQPPVIQKQVCQTWTTSQSKVVKQPEAISEQEAAPEPEEASDPFVSFGGIQADPTDPSTNAAPEGIYDMGAESDADTETTCMLVYEPLCAVASDGSTITFDNTCEMESAQKKDTIEYEVLHSGACSGDESGF